MSSIQVNVAGVVFRLEGETAEYVPRIPSAYHAFQTSDKSVCHARYRCLAPDRPRLPRIEPGSFVWQSDIWRMGMDTNGRYVIEIHDVVQSRWVPSAAIAPDFSAGDLQAFAGRRAAPSDYELNYPTAQVILTNLLGQHGVIVLHAAAVIIDGKGVVFGGRSDVGKTTLSRLCRDRGATLINDDRCALFIRDGQPWVIATPWHGEDPEINVMEAPLAGIFHLHQEPACRMTALAPSLALARLLATGIAPFYRREGLERATQLMADLVECAPSYDFGVRPDHSAFVILRETLLDPALKAS